MRASKSVRSVSTKPRKPEGGRRLFGGIKTGCLAHAILFVEQCLVDWLCVSVASVCLYACWCASVRLGQRRDKEATPEREKEEGNRASRCACGCVCVCAEREVEEMPKKK